MKTGRKLFLSRFFVAKLTRSLTTNRGFNSQRSSPTRSLWFRKFNEFYKLSPATNILTMDRITQIAIAGGLILALIIFARVVNKKHRGKKRRR